MVTGGNSTSDEGLLTQNIREGDWVGVTRYNLHHLELSSVCIDRNMWLAKLNFGILSGIAVYGQYLSATPAVIPLIHKAPYVNSWINTNGNITRLVGYEWPQFFNGQVQLLALVLTAPH